MSTLRINNIEAQSVPASPTIDEKVKVTNSSGDILVNIDGKTSGITTIGINTTDGNIKFDANSNVLITGILTATTLAGNFTPDSLEIGSNIKLGNAGVVTATSFVGSGANLTGITQTTINNNADNRVITGSGTANTLNGESNVIIDSSGRLLIGTTTEGQGNADELTLSFNNTGVSGGDQGRCGMTIRSGDNTSGVTQNGYIYFSDGTSGNNEYRGVVAYSHSDDSMYFSTSGTERLRIDSSGRLLIGTTTEGAAAADDLTISSSGDTGITIRSGTTHNGAIHFSDATSGGGEYAGQIDYDHNNDSMNFYAGNDQCLRLLDSKIVSVSEKLILENGTVFLNKHSVGIGTTTQTGRNAGVSTATGTIIYNAETEKVQVYANAVWRNVGSLEPDQSAGYYSSLSAAQSAGLSHYWPGNSSTSLISGLQPDDRKGNPTFNNKEHDGYGATNPFFHFAGQTGGDSPTGYRYTHSADWVGHSFTICYWVKVMQEVTEGESTYVQLGNHSGLRSMFAMSCSGSTNLRGKTITIGDDNANDQIQYEFANWIHVGVRYNYGANSATYYKNGVQTENHTFNGSLSVGTGSNHIYLGYGYWNGSTSNKESCSRMSDIGIWDSTSINGAVFMDIYKAGRIVKGY